MDDIDRELISLLCTKIAILMEDHIILALTAGSQSYSEQKATLNKLTRASTKIEKLTAAAQSIAE